jgi:hypothetical protein
MDFVPLIVIGSLLKKTVDFLKFLTGKDWNSAITQVVVWGVGVLLVWLLSASDFANGIIIGGIDLGNMNASSIVLVGLALASTASLLGQDLIKALDNTQTAAAPPLVPLPPAGQPVQPAQPVQQPVVK